MKFTSRHIISAMLAVVAMAMLSVMSSCSDDALGVEPGWNDGPRQAVFTITLDGADRISRATPVDGEYDRGSGLENYIDIDGYDYACYLFSTDNRLVSELNVTSVVKIDNNTNGRSYTITAGLRPFEITAIERGCKVAILANWGTYPLVKPGSTTIKSLCASANTRMAYDASMATLSTDNLVPMYGIKTFTGGFLAEDEDTFRIGTVRLLRAYAKVELNAIFEGFDEAANASVTSVELTRCYDAAYKMQAAAYATDESDYVHGSWFKDYTPVNIPAGASTITVPLVKNETSGSFIAYVPEYDNCDADGNSRSESELAQLKVTFEADGVEHSGYLDFVQSGTPVDIARNNWYRFNATITAKQDVELDCVVDIVPFSSVDLSPSIGLEREPLSGYAPIKDPATGKILYWQDKWGTPWILGNSSGDLYVTVNGQKCLMVFHYFQPNHPLNHWFDSEGNQRSFEAEDITWHLYTPVDASDSGWPDWYVDSYTTRYWITTDRGDGWVSSAFSQYVWFLTDWHGHWGNPAAQPACWYDFTGGWHAVSEKEEEVLADVYEFLNN